MQKLMTTAIALYASAFLLTGIARADDKTFTVWWFEQPGSAEQVTWSKVVDAFQAAHPEITVKFEQKSFMQLEQSGTMILNSDGAPDVTEYNKGNATAGVAASQGLLTNLDDVVKARGWDKILNDGDFVLSRYDSKGVFGSGSIYGVPSIGEFVAVFYNQDMFAANNVKVPTTTGEFSAAMDAFKQKGIVPLAFSPQDYEPVLGVLVDANMDQTWFQNYQGLKAPLDEAPFLHAAQTLTDWIGKGYLPPDASGLKDADAQVMFTSGKSPMYIGGSWNLGAMSKNVTTFKWSEFLLPTPRYTVGSTGSLWVVPARSTHKDLAYEFISLALSPKFQTEESNNGGIAISVDPSTITNPVGQQASKIFADISGKGGLGYYLGWPVPGFRDVIEQKYTGLVAGSVTPQQFADGIKAAYDDYQASQ